MRKQILKMVLGAYTIETLEEGPHVSKRHATTGAMSGRFVKGHGANLSVPVGRVPLLSLFEDIREHWTAAN